MSIIADKQSRLYLKRYAVKPGDEWRVEQLDEDHLHLTRLKPPEKRKPRRSLLELLKAIGPVNIKPR